MPYTFLYEIHNHLQLIPSTADDIVSHMQYGDKMKNILQNEKLLQKLSIMITLAEISIIMQTVFHQLL